jgi:hypothetical protein
MVGTASSLTHRLIHADRILVVDECGNNANMKKDKRARGEKCVTGKGECPMIPCASDDSHFTTMGFTNVLGVPVLFVIIITKPQN